MVVTVPAIEGRPVQWYLGVVTGEAVTGLGHIVAVMACPREEDGCHEGARAVDLRDARDAAIFEMLREAAERGANAVIGVGLGYESIDVSSDAKALMVTASGTAVRV
ncbi:MAG TPA: heavy metal-binding domain-containing protein [Candidatus Dormibacteraeota bacterium]